MTVESNYITNKFWTTWFSSDIHFGHENVIKFCDRPFKDIDDMKEQIIKNHNRLVKPEDLVVHVGDMFFYHRPEEMKEVLDQMNGRKVLVRGNHDQKPRQMMNAGYQICVEQMDFIIANQRVHVSHYPYRMDEKLMRYLKIKKKVHKLLGLRPIYFEKYHERRPKDDGCFLIHGHTHDKVKTKGRMIHVGVDAWGYKPVNIQKIANMITEIKKNEKC